LITELNQHPNYLETRDIQHSLQVKIFSLFPDSDLKTKR